METHTSFKETTSHQGRYSYNLEMSTSNLSPILKAFLFLRRKNVCDGKCSLYECVCGRVDWLC